MAQAGVDGAAISTWYTLSAPKGTPADVIEALRATLAQINADASWQKFLGDQGAERVDLSPRETTAFVEADKLAMAKLLGSLNLLDK